MMQRIRESLEARRNGEDKGFTLVELLVVIVIIGILAAIAIPAFLKQREEGWAASVTSDLKNAATAMETGAIRNGGSYEDIDAAALATFGYNETEGVTITVESATAQGFTLEGTHANLTDRGPWTYDSENGGLQPEPAPTTP